MTGTAITEPERDFDCPVTGARDWELVKRYDAPPPGETDFGLSPYRRDLLRSPETGHVVNRHAMDLSDLYGGAYWDQTYGGGRMAQIFERIMALPPAQSDNRARVDFIEHFLPGVSRTDRYTLLDVGSGLAVFPAAMKLRGWSVTAMDPDPRSAVHARDNAGVFGLVGDFMTDRPDGLYGLVSFNKVLEHVADPVTMLARAHAVLEPGGVVYVELPDGEAALSEAGPDREEFFVEHFCAFSAVSYAMLAFRAGFRTALLQRVVEPSGKFTLRGLLTPVAAPQGP